MPVRSDIRLEAAPLVPVSCHTCGAQVEARKSSWDQTSIQWTGATLAACAERASLPSDPDGHVFTGCSALRESIREAAVSGRLKVLSDEPLPTNPDAAAEAHS